MTAPALTPDELARHNAFFLAPEFNAIVTELEDDK